MTPNWENSQNHAGGCVLAPERQRELTDVAHGRNVRVHLDGARIFNASVALNTTVADLSKFCDSVQFCLSKGLGAPVGSLLLSNQ